MTRIAYAMLAWFAYLQASPGLVLPHLRDELHLSYSAGVNYRIAESLAVFGRYSRGARAAADRILFTSAITPSGGGLLRRKNRRPRE